MKCNIKRGQRGIFGVRNVGTRVADDVLRGMGNDGVKWCEGGQAGKGRGLSVSDLNSDHKHL